MAPTRREADYEGPDAAELLIREAWQLGRRRRLANTVVVIAALLVAATLVSTAIYYSKSKPSFSTGSANTANASSTPRCLLGQLAVTSLGQVGAGGTDGGILIFRNISSQPCSLVGYPNVVAVNKYGLTIEASHVSSGMLGGWDWSGVSTPPKPPIVVLAHKNEVASDWYQYSENGPAGYTLFVANTLSISLSGSAPTVRINGSVDAAEDKMWVTPFVPGKSGTAEPKRKL